MGVRMRRGREGKGRIGRTNGFGEASKVHPLVSVDAIEN